ncbi:MAG: RsmD family RNA methyltransferase [Tannerella sp.]|jgi:16S rRNA (guanine(966)-N(2))-methyltransferase RsmD|nr:RsmD family RNA methyltransferase [Tannerella sp.]
MRIIRGKYGHRRFKAPASFHARPTTDFAKENLFNVLDNLVEWESMDALDLFSGTGSIAFEMLSRGCRSVTAVETNYKHISFIEKVAKTLNINELNLIRGDVLRYLSSVRNVSFGLIFADPPYDFPAMPDLPNLILNSSLLREGGFFILEHSKNKDFSTLPYFSQRRVYGAVNFSIFVKAKVKKDA